MVLASLIGLKLIMNIFTRFLLTSLVWGLGLGFAFGGTPDENPEEPFKITCMTLSQPLIRADTCGQGVGSIVLNHDGTPPFTYVWGHDAGLSDSIATGLTSGPYQVTVTDVNGCTDSKTYIVGQVNPLTATMVTLPDTCDAGKGSASIDVTQINGGQAPYTFLWDANAGNATTPGVTGLAAGNYEVVVTDGRGCARTVSGTVDGGGSDFDVDVIRQAVLCFGENTGAATAIPSGGNPEQYAYEWTMLGDTTVLGRDSILNGIPAGNYRLRVYDEVGGRTGSCSYNGVVVISQPDTFDVSVDVEQTLGCNSGDGLGVANPRGGVQPYSFEWTRTGDPTVISTNDSLIGVSADIFNLTVTDDNGCIATSDFAITSVPGPIFSLEVLQEDDCGKGEGIARVIIERGTPPYQILWWTNPIQPTDTARFAYNLRMSQPGNPYTVTVVGADSCLQQIDFAMPGNDSLSIAVVNQEDDYCNLRIGQATVDVQGGTLPYQFDWSTTPPVNASTITGLPAGTYEVRVIDSLNCDISTEITLVNELGFDLEVEVTDESCQGQADGEARAVVTGGRPPFTYLWDSNPVQRTPVASDLSGGVYTVQVQDADGCQRQAFNEVEAVNTVEADFAFSPDINTPMILSEAIFEFTNLTVGADSYLWTFGDGDSSRAINPIHTYADSGSFFVKLKAFNNSEGCVDSVTYGPFVVTSDGQVWVPNAFSPNGDDINDRFVVQGNQVDQFELRIFSRWGQTVFTSNSPDEAWDGTLPNGQEAPTGNYAYFLRTVVEGEQPLEYSGFVFLVR